MHGANLGLRWLVLILTASSASAVELADFDTKTPDLEFDVPAVLVCHDVTTASFRDAWPGERLLRIEAPVSLLLYHGEAARIRDVVIEIDGAEAGLRVHDYAPRTELVSEHSEPIETKSTRGIDKTLGGSVGAKLSGDAALLPTVSGGITSKETTTETASRLPPMRALVVSGATNQRRGVFFKLRPTSQSTLEGERTFSVTFAAPADWPGGRIDVRCLARGRKKWLLVEQRRVWNETTRPVELRLVSHTVAKPVSQPAVE